MVTDGVIRDVADMARCDLHVYAAGTTPAPPIGVHEAVDLMVPVACAGVAICAGDVLVGDADGVVCVPHAIASDVAAEAADRWQLEAFLARRLDAGEPLDGTYPPDAATLAAYEHVRPAE